ncbi:RNA polymerase sigma factor [Desulfosporosinus youngiae]|uniref:RNA polymerase sigma factor, sigma-70 family n=1 Tax=Desulfosporosinus youngiae DSM 17734 TaxID=768710 RepID=H5XTJ8_9FIRM|nr:sigma-70 family RNA polymerase sigma factor [Desulfosporosinus youngiae]EHQ88597.1 RNA polymerase sigma factor, sigma-70 family [Desulfosporosinus youngiae DSM 17734]
MSFSGANLNIFEILVKQHYKKVYQTVYTYTKDKYISEDAVQQAFLIAYKKLHQLNSKDKFASWVTSIALNEAKRMLNNKNNTTITSITEFHLNRLQDSKEFDIELKEDVGNVLKKLKQKDMEILVYKYYACFLQDIFHESCKLFFHSIATPFSTKLQVPFHTH